MGIPAELREYAETPDRFALVPEGAVVRRFADERVCVVAGPTWASVSGVRVGEGEVESLLGEVRTLVPAESFAVWWIGPSAQPARLDEQLAALGLREPRDRISLLHALVLDREPADAPAGVDVQRVESFEQFLAAREVQWDAFEVSEERRVRQRARFRDEFADSQRFGVPVGFLATLGGRPAATALGIPSERGVFLVGGATANWARGRGLYRALVRARWDYAVGRGTPALVAHAVRDTSYPILRRLGFEEVCEIRRLEDAPDPDGAPGAS